jgi:hypothetical protein
MKISDRYRYCLVAAAMTAALLLLVLIGISVSRQNPRQADWPAPWETR